MSEKEQKQWYVVRAIGGKEKKVKEYLSLIHISRKNPNYRKKTRLQSSNWTNTSDNSRTSVFSGPTCRSGSIRRPILPKTTAGTASNGGSGPLRCCSTQPKRHSRPAV